MQTQSTPVQAGKEIGMLFKPDLIRALLREESPKTQTRRVIDPELVLEDLDSMVSQCRFQVGDRMYAKESLYLGADNCWYYTADDAPVMVLQSHQGAMLAWTHHKEGNSHSALFMPKWAARIWREIEEIQVQRIGDISEEDAIAEGIDFVNTGGATRHSRMFRNYLSADIRPKFQFADPRDSFRSLWNSINGNWTPVRKGGKLLRYESYPWSKEDLPEKPLNAIRKDILCLACPNPWVWCFKFHTGNSDG